MYALAVKRDFMSQHFLIGGDWGAENQKHTHHYQLELQLEGPSLDKHGYLVDITELDAALNSIVEYYRDHTLNELPEFKDLNPSIEQFARILCQTFAAHLRAPNLSAVIVKLWENESAWAAYRLERQPYPGQHEQQA